MLYSRSGKNSANHFRESKVKLYYLFITFFILHFFAVKNGYSQFSKTDSNFFTTRCNTTSDEIMITIFDEGNLSVKFTNLETSATSTYTRNESENIDGGCDLILTSEGLPGDGLDQVINPDTPYKIEFITGGITRHTLLYLQCTDNTDLTQYSFYCPITIGVTDRNDLYIDYLMDTNEIIILPESFVNVSEENPDGVEVIIGSNDWILPYNQYFVQDNNFQINYFLAAQIPSSLQLGPFELIDEDLTVWDRFGTSFTWEIDDVELKFASGTSFVVEGTLITEGTTFTANGSNWDGFDFKDGSEATLTNVNILKVGSGAYTGSFTVRDGADVTILTDSDNIVLGPNFKAELGSTFLASYVSGSSSAEQGPAPEFVLDEHDQEGDATGDRNPGRSPLIVAESYPNPFNPSTQIRYQLSADAQVTLKIYNVLGQELRTLVSEFQSAGTWAFTWDGRDGAGSMVPSGTYLYRITAGDEIQSGQMVLVK